MRLIFLVLLVLINSIILLTSQNQIPDGGGVYEIEKSHNCITNEERVEIHKAININQLELQRKGLLKKSPLRNNVSFGWPLRKTPDLNYNSYYATNNFVDQDLGASVKDYYCTSRTYDGHRGTDIDTWPFPWYLYENNLVEIIAAAGGTIIGKYDGNEDDHCSCSGKWNAIYIQHEDGSVAWYGHMKKNSLNCKYIGQKVIKGEYLGVVASSGCSTQPHLHFEVYDNAGNLIDPYSGNCNYMNNSTWWEFQPSYRESTLNVILTHDTIPVHGCPSGNEQPNISNSFSSGDEIYFAVYFHDELNGDVTNLTIRRPNNSIWDSWIHTSTFTSTKSWWYWIKTIPAHEPSGTWKYEVTYNGQVFTHEFNYLSHLVDNSYSFGFNGNGDYVEISDNNSLDIIGNFTIEAWIKPNDIGGEKTILVKDNADQCGNYGLFLKDGNLSYVSAGACGWHGRSSNSKIKSGIWQHIAVVGIGTNLNFYIDGEFKDEINIGSITGPINSDNLWIGRSNNTLTNLYFNGLIDEVRIWDMAKSSSEIQDQMNIELSGLESNLQLYYKFDEINIDCDVVDCSPNENHGTRNNFISSVNAPQLFYDNPIGLNNVKCGVELNKCENGIEDLTSTNETFDFELKIYPNPSKSIIFIDNRNDKKEYFQIISIHGKSLISGHIDSTNKSIDISNLSAGVYFVKLGRKASKILKI